MDGPDVPDPAEDERRTLAIDGRVPTKRQLAEATSGKVDVHVLRMPRNIDNLSFLDPLGGDITSLTVTDYQCKDVRAIQKFTDLRHLYLWVDLRHPVDLSGLSLESFAGRWHKHIDSVFYCHSLRDLMMELPPADALTRVPQAVKKLRLSGIKGREYSFSSMNPAAALTRIEIAGARVADLKGIENLGALSELHLVSIAEVRNALTLAKCHSLRKLALEGCKSVEGLAAALEGGDLEQVLVVGRPKYAAEINRLICEKGWHWINEG